MPMNIGNDNYYLKHIDGIRGIAILAVVGYHYAPSIVRGGFMGVDIFFVISGWLITDVILRSCISKEFT
jgi:peptidoglycan/LPS O-acetylase OafA/YrhL